MTTLSTVQHDGVTYAVHHHPSGHPAAYYPLNGPHAGQALRSLPMTRQTHAHRWTEDGNGYLNCGTCNRSVVAPPPARDVWPADPADDGNARHGIAVAFAFAAVITGVLLAPQHPWWGMALALAGGLTIRLVWVRSTRR